MKRLLLSGLLSLWMGCGVSPRKPPVSLGVRPALTAADYPDVLGDWTRSERIYNNVGSVLFVNATLLSPELTTVAKARGLSVWGPGGEVVDDVSQRPKTPAPGGPEFFFSASTSVTRWNDFGNHDTIWRITLENESGARLAGEVTKIKTTANVRSTYPYVTEFSKTYLVRFPPGPDGGPPLLGPGTRSLTLRFTSGLGEAVLVWDFR